MIVSFLTCVILISDAKMSDSDSTSQAVVIYDEKQFSHPFAEFKKSFKTFSFSSGPSGHFFEVKIKQDWDAVGVAGVVWESAEILSIYFSKYPGLVRNKRVLELGAGTGLCSIVCKHLGAEQVIATDRKSVIHALKENVELNFSDVNSSDSVVVNILDWTEIDTKWEMTFSPDIILGADLVYIDELFDDLLKTLLKVTSKQTVVYFCSKIRYDRDLKFYELLRINGFEFEVLLSVPDKSINIYKIHLKS
ncbi:protein N-lysine methyltransferase METTL21A-like [Symsagittifera roscoffensis]|uniref:protein N-lysine methyltransferase METTL21A-like n=1 Tax=Symsagittifera roscoffensis TaxID=84072 RepID=UPI00307C3388